jgi:hypothetical protein
MGLEPIPLAFDTRPVGGVPLGYVIGTTRLPGEIAREPSRQGFLSADNLSHGGTSSKASPKNQPLPCTCGPGLSPAAGRCIGISPYAGREACARLGEGLCELATVAADLNHAGRNG